MEKRETMTDNELLLAFSDLIDKKLAEQLEPLKREIQDIKLDLEHELEPKLALILENYVPASKRYETSTDRIESMKADIDLLKMVVAEHSGKIQAIS